MKQGPREGVSLCLITPTVWKRLEDVVKEDHQMWSKIHCINNLKMR
jgi:hypothetical protein